MISGKNVQECDATDDEQHYKSWLQKMFQNPFAFVRKGTKSKTQEMFQNPFNVYMKQGIEHASTNDFNPFLRGKMFQIPFALKNPYLPSVPIFFSLFL